MNWVTYHWRRSPSTCSSRSSPNGRKSRHHRDHQLALLRVGRASSPAPVYARPCSTGIPIKHISSKPAQNRSASAEHWGRNPKVTSEAWLRSPSAPPSGLRSRRTEYRNILPTINVQGGPKQNAEVGQAKLSNACLPAWAETITGSD
jgi:hypothetical protein